jgi:protocatechuate 3,4-dioxygenase beta subunit
MENEQTTGSRLLSRRTALTAAGAVTLGVAGVTSIVEAVSAAGSDAAGPIARAAANACALTPEVTEGPYYLPLEIVRKNITEGRNGVPLALRIRVIDAATCKSIQGAVVDIWHCNALGMYSGYAEMGAGATIEPPGSGPSGMPPSGSPPMPGGPDGPGGAGGHAEPTDNETFLRGVQMTDERGTAEFSSLFPGWYAGRTVHLHAKVHVGAYITDGLAQGGHVSHTGQFFFTEDLTRAVSKLAPYRSNKTPRTTNAQDMHYNRGGAAGLLSVVPRDRHHLSDGLLSTITVSVDPDATPAPV